MTQSKEASSIESVGTVSVIVPSKNSFATIERCLESIRGQTYNDVEVIVVDNFSTDGTQQIADRLADRLISAGPERSPQTNLGVKAATGEWVYRVDADFVIDRDLIREAVEVAKTSNADAILTLNRSDESVSRWARARAFEREMYEGDNLNVAARFVKRSLWLELNGLDETLTAGEDYDFHARLVERGAVIEWVKSTELHLGEPKSLREVIAKHYFYGSEMRRYVAKRGASSARQLAPIRPAFVRHWRKFVTHPLRAVEFLVYLTVKYAAGGLGYLLGGRRTTSPV